MDAPNNSLNSPLLIAASKGHDNIIRVLLDYGAVVTLCNINDRDAFYMAALYIHRSMGFANTMYMLHFNNADLINWISLARLLYTIALLEIFLVLSDGLSPLLRKSTTRMTPLQQTYTTDSPERGLLEGVYVLTWIYIRLSVDVLVICILRKC